MKTLICCLTVVFDILVAKSSLPVTRQVWLSFLLVFHTYSTCIHPLQLLSIQSSIHLSFTLSAMPKVKLDLYRIYMSPNACLWTVGRSQSALREPNANTRRTCKLHTKNLLPPHLGETNPEPSHHEESALTTAPLHSTRFSSNDCKSSEIKWCSRLEDGGKDIFINLSISPLGLVSATLPWYEQFNCT